MPVNLLGRGVPSLLILKWEGVGLLILTSPRLRLWMFCWSFKPIFILSSFHPGAAIAYSPCLHRSRFISCSSLRGTGLQGRCTSSRGLQFLLGDQSGLTRHQLGPPRQWHPCQVRTLMEEALLSHQSMVIASRFDPSREVLQSVKSELLLHKWHVIKGALLLEAQHLLLEWEEVGAELLLHLHPFCLLKGGNIMPIVDLESMLKVLLPPYAPVSHGQDHGVVR